MLWSLRWRLLIVAGLCVAAYLFEPGFHLHGTPGPDTPVELLDPAGLAFTLANLAGASMLVLLAGFVSTDRRRGYYRIYFAHPTRPLAYYGLRWLLSYGISMGTAAAFLVVGQLVACAQLREAGVRAMVQAVLMALIYGGLTAFLSVMVSRGDSLIALAVFALAEIWQAMVQTFAEVGQAPFTPLVRQAIGFVLPPHLALNDIFYAWTVDSWAWGAIAYAAGYGLFWLILAALLLRTREWP